MERAAHFDQPAPCVELNKSDRCFPKVFVKGSETKFLESDLDPFCSLEKNVCIMLIFIKLEDRLT